MSNYYFVDIYLLDLKKLKIGKSGTDKPSFDAIFLGIKSLRGKILK